MHAHRATRVLALASVVAAVVAAGTASGATVRFVSVSVPPGQTIAQLRTQQFVEKVTCTKACDVTTYASISLADARRLGYRGATPSSRLVQIASSFRRVKAGTPTAIPLVVSARGKRLLAKATSRLRLVGRVIAIPRAHRRTHIGATWQTTLR